MKLTKITIAENNHKCNYCTRLFSIFFISNAGIGVYLFTINTWIEIKEMFLNIMIMFIIHNIKWKKSNKLTFKIELIIIKRTLS